MPKKPDAAPTNTPSISVELTDEQQGMLTWLASQQGLDQAAMLQQILIEAIAVETAIANT